MGCTVMAWATNDPLVKSETNLDVVRAYCMCSRKCPSPTTLPTHLCNYHLIYSFSTRLIHPTPFTLLKLPSELVPSH